MGNSYSNNNNLGLDVLDDDAAEVGPLDLADFVPSPLSGRDKAPKEAIRNASRDAGFHDRGEPTTEQTKIKTPAKSHAATSRSEAADTKPKLKRTPTIEIGAMRRSRYYRTGRNTQLNIKVRSEDRDRIKEFCDRQEWVVGQALEYALDALEEKLINDKDTFWKEHTYRGVE